MKILALSAVALSVFCSPLLVPSVFGSPQNDASAQTDDHDSKDKDRDDADDKDNKDAAYFRGILVKAELKLDESEDKDHDKDKDKDRDKDKDDDKHHKPHPIHLFYTFAKPAPKHHRFLPIITSIEDDEKARCAEVVIRFNTGFTPRQLTSECQVSEALAGGEITLAPGHRLFRCDVEGDAGIPSKELFFVTQPQTQILRCDTNLVLSVTVGGKPPFKYQWRLCDTAIAGATNSVLVIGDADPSSQGDFSVVVTRKDHFIISDTASILPEPVPPLKLLDPLVDNLLLVCWAESCTDFLLQQSFDGALWSSVNVPVGTLGADNCVTVTQVPNRQFRLISTDFLAPKILSQPASQTNALGSPIVLNVQASGTPPLGYQWRLNGEDLPGATGTTLVIPQARLTNFGSYDVAILNGVDAVLSSQAIVVPSGLGAGLSDFIATAGASIAANGSILGTNIGYSKESGEPNHAGVPGGKSAWFCWTAPTNGIVTFDTRGSSFDTVLAAYSLAGAFLVPVASDDDSGGFKTSLIQFGVLTGETYKIAVDGNPGTNALPTDGAIVLNWSVEVTDDPFPRIIQQPSDTVVLLEPGAEGATVTGTNFLVSAVISGSLETPAFQWRRNGVDLTDDANVTGTTTSALTINPNILAVSRPLVGTYSVVIRSPSHPSRFIESRGATLQIVTDPNIRFVDKLFEVFSPPPAPASIRGTAFLDSVTNGLGAVAITLTGPGVSTTKFTSKTGAYVFGNLAPSTYNVSAPQFLGASNGAPFLDNTNLTVTVAAGETSIGNDFGYLSPGGIGLSARRGGKKTPAASLARTALAPGLQPVGVVAKDGAPLSSGTIIAGNYSATGTIGISATCHTNGFVSKYVISLAPTNLGFLVLDTIGSTTAQGTPLGTVSINYTNFGTRPIACCAGVENPTPVTVQPFPVTNGFRYLLVVDSPTNSKPAIIHLNYHYTPRR